MSKPITIHKHTPKRYKRSVWVVSNIMSIDGVTMYSTNCTAPMLVQAAPMLVQDIKTGLENPLDLSTSLGSVEMWNEWGQESTREKTYQAPIHLSSLKIRWNEEKSIKRVVEQDGQIKTVEVEIDPKKSIWQRITNKIRNTND